MDYVIKSTRRRTEKPADVDELYEQMKRRGIINDASEPGTGAADTGKNPEAHNDECD